MRDITVAVLGFLTLAMPSAATPGELQSVHGALLAANAMAAGVEVPQQSNLLSYQQLALPYVTDQGPAWTSQTVAEPQSDSLASFRVPRNAPYFANEMIEAAKLGNTRTGIAAMAAASARVTASAKAAITGDGFGGITKRTVSKDIANYFFAIARSNPAAAIELSEAIAPGTGLRKALKPSAAVAETLRRMEATARANFRPVAVASSSMPPLQQLYQRSLAISEHPDIATDLSTLASLYYALGQHDGAQPLYERALAIREKALGPGQPDVTTSLDNLAVLYYAQGRYAEAEPLYQRALAIRERALGAEHADVTTSLSNLAVLYYAQGRYAEAEPLYQRALANSEKALGPEHPAVASSLVNYAGLLWRTGREDEADAIEARAKTILAKTP